MEDKNYFNWVIRWFVTSILLLAVVLFLIVAVVNQRALIFEQRKTIEAWQTSEQTCQANKSDIEASYERTLQELENLKNKK